MAKTRTRKKNGIKKKNIDSQLEDVAQKELLILAEEVMSHDGKHKIGIMMLNSAKTLNAVDLEMVNQIDDVLDEWQRDDDIVAMIMHGAGDKAFCAGGDIRKLYDSMQANGDEHLRYADDFFTAEYSKNYRVHLFGKPIIAWGHGFVMGGGLGLFIGSSHKVGTETLKLAWPEVRIGLFPDVAGSYYLSRLPFPLGHWMGLTGSQMNAIDCKRVGLIDYCLGNDDLPSVIEELRKQPWQGNKAMNNQYVRELLKSFEKESDTEFPTSNYDDNKFNIEKVFSAVNSKIYSNDMSLTSQVLIIENKRLLSDFMDKFSEIKTDNIWFNQGRDNLYTGCPATAHLVMQQLELGKNMTLKDVVQWELNLAFQSVRHPDFAEGVRSMVIDKDFTPKWQHLSVRDVPITWVVGLLESLWSEDEHPFRVL